MFGHHFPSLGSSDEYFRRAGWVSIAARRFEFGMVVDDDEIPVHRKNAHVGSPRGCVVLTVAAVYDRRIKIRDLQ